MNDAEPEAAAAAEQPKPVVSWKAIKARIALQNAAKAESEAKAAAPAEERKWSMSPEMRAHLLQAAKKRAADKKEKEEGQSTAAAKKPNPLISAWWDELLAAELKAPDKKENEGGQPTPPAAAKKPKSSMSPEMQAELQAAKTRWLIKQEEEAVQPIVDAAQALTKLALRLRKGLEVRDSHAQALAALDAARAEVSAALIERLRKK